MLTTEQLTAARQKLGITPMASAASTVDRASEFDQAWGEGDKAAVKDQSPGLSVDVPVIGSVPIASKSQVQIAKNTVGDIGASFNQRADEVGKILNDPNKGALGKTFDVLGKGADVINDSAGAVIKNVVGDDTMHALGEHLAPLVAAAKDSPAGKGVLDWFHGLSPETQDHLKATGSIVSLLSNAIGAGAGGKVAANAAKDAAVAAGEGIHATMPTLSGLKKTVQTAAAKGNIPGVEGVGAQTTTSAGRLAEKAPLIGAGAAREAKPTDVYNAFAQQEAKHLADIKHDPAISIVGSRIGDAFDDVVKQRQAAGKTMAAELEHTASREVPAADVIDNFHKELAQSGAGLERTDKGLDILSSKTSKFSTDDNKILKVYASELDKLGEHPTMAEVDAFVSRIPKEIDGLKASANITFNTNAERIIKNNLKEWRSTLEKNGTTGYAQARKQYSDLSSFIDEGAKHLGKITQSGDYAKDASIAKSSVQSVLNNGKKDWLIKLEDLTGYPALDESTLALQAMKDAGDFKGNSLLELLTEGASGSVPVTPHGVLGKIMGVGGKMLGKAVVGSKAEQTRALLKQLEEEAGKAKEAIKGSKQGASAAESSGKSSIVEKAKTLFDKIKKEGNKGFVKIPGIDKPVPNPDVIAKELSAGDFKAMQEYVNIKADGANTFVPPSEGMALDEAMERLGLQKFSTRAKPLFPTEQSKLIYLQEVLRHYNEQGVEGATVVGKAVKSPKPITTKPKKK